MALQMRTEGTLTLKRRLPSALFTYKRMKKAGGGISAYTAFEAWSK